PPRRQGTDSMTQAERAVQIAEQLLVKTPPPGVDVDYVRGWFARMHPVLIQAMAEALGEPALPPPRPATPISSGYSSPPPGEPDAWSVKDRTRANLAAIQILAEASAAHRPLTQAERIIVMGYSGWGGLSLDKVEK